MDVGIEAKISSLIQHQFPSFYQNEGPMFILFVKAYYEWLEQTNNALFYSRKFLSFRDIDDTLESFLSHFQKKYLYGIPFDVVANKRLLLKHVLDVYRSKGSIQGYKLLFRLIYNEDCDVYLPGRDVLRISDGKWKEIRYCEITDAEYSKTFVGKTVIGISSKVLAVCENYTREPQNGQRVNTLFLTNISPTDGDFEIGEKLLLYEDFYTPGNKVLSALIASAPTVLGSLDSIEIINGGRQFRQGDLIKIAQKDLISGDVISNGVDGIVKVTETFGGRGRILFEILFGGSGYTLDSKKILYNGPNDTSGSGASFDLGSYFNTEIVDYNSDVITNLLFEPINSPNYGLTRNPEANLTSFIGDSLTFQRRRFGSISSLARIRTGSFYDEPLKVFVRSAITSGPMPGKVEFNTACTHVSAVQYQFNANTDISNVDDTIQLTEASDFEVNDFVYYSVDVGNTAISGLTTNTKYYISYSNDTHIALANSYGGANINITASTISEVGHRFTGTEFTLFFEADDTICLMSDSANSETDSFNVIQSVVNNTTLILHGRAFSNSTSNGAYKVAPEIYPANFDFKDPKIARPDETVAGRNALISGTPSFGNNVVSKTKAVNSGRGYVDGENVTLYLYGGLTTPEVLNGGTGYANGEQLVFRGGLPQKEATATVITDVFGTIDEISMTYNGAGYSSPPDILVRTKKGTGAKLQSTVTEFNDLYEVTGRVVKKGIGRKTGYWQTTDGFLNSDKYIQDSYYYQDFSYQINAALSLGKYKDILYNTFHTAGTELFGQFFSTSVSESIFFNDTPSDNNISVYVESAVDFDTADTGELTADIEFFTIDAALSDIKREENLFLYSEQFDNTYWTSVNASITANVAADRDGANTIDQLIADNTSGIHGVYAQTAQLSRFSRYFMSVHASANTGKWLALFWNSPNTTIGYFDLENGVVGSANGEVSPTQMSIEETEPGLFRCSIEVTPTVSPSKWYICVANGDNQVQFQSNDSLAIDLWGAQLERGGDLLPYSKTVFYPLSIRDSYPGVLYGVRYIANSRSNMLLDSEDFDTSLWTTINSNVYGDEQIAPDGRLTAEKFADTLTANAIFRIEPTSDISFAGNTTYTYSVYAKIAGGKNLLYYSTELGNALGWTKNEVTVANNTQLAPTNNLQHAETITSTNATSQHYLKSVSRSIPFVEGETYTFSIYLKANTEPVVQLIANNETFGPNVWANFDIASNTVGSNGSLNNSTQIEAANSNWYRCSFSGTAVKNTNGTDMIIAFTSNNAAASRLPTVSTTSTQRFFAYGGQIEEGTLTDYTNTAERNWFSIDLDQSNTQSFNTRPIAFFNLYGEVGNTQNANAEILELYDGWYRCSITATATANSANNRPGIQLAANDGIERFDGVGNDGIYIWGTQLEANSKATSYIKTSKGKNFLIYSSQFGNELGWSKTEVTVVNNSIVAPNDLEVGDTIVASNGTSQHLIKSIPVGIPFLQGQTYTMSVFLKANTDTVVQIAANSSTFGSDVWANFDLQNGVVGSNGSLNTNTQIEVDLYNWYRCSISGVATQNTVGTELIISFVNNNVSATRTPIVTTVSTQQFFTYGAQISQGTGPIVYNETEQFSQLAGSFELQPQ